MVKMLAKFRFRVTRNSRERKHEITKTTIFAANLSETLNILVRSQNLSGAGKVKNERLPQPAIGHNVYFCTFRYLLEFGTNSFNVKNVN